MKLHELRAQKVPPKTAREEAAVPLPDRVRPAEEV